MFSYKTDRTINTLNNLVFGLALFVYEDFILSLKMKYHHCAQKLNILFSILDSI